MAVLSAFVHLAEGFRLLLIVTPMSLSSGIVISRWPFITYLLELWVMGAKMHDFTASVFSSSKYYVATYNRKT